MASMLENFKQPKPFYMIFFVEMWERFGFYGMQALLAVYFVKSLGMSDVESFSVMGAFMALVYGFVSIGGYIGDRVLGTKRTMVFGAIVLAIGYFLLAASVDLPQIIFIALGTICIGNGLFKANPSSLLSKCYKEGDPKLDGAFTLYYMSINLGSFISMSLTPTISEHFGWSMAYVVCGIGLVIALLNYMVCRHWVDHVGSEAGMKQLSMNKLITVIVGSVVFIFISAYLLEHLKVAHWVLTIVAVSVVLYYFYETAREDTGYRAKMVVAFILMLVGVVFFVLYMQMPMSLNFFAINNVEHNILGISINPISFQALNPFWIVAISPILAFFYSHFGTKGKDLSMPFKFSIGMFLCAFAFLVLPLGAKFANAQGMVSSNWVILSYLLQSVGELMISGLGLSMVAQLVPQRLMGLVMGIWFLTSATAAVIGGWVSTLTAAPKGVTDPLQTLPLYSHVFMQIGVVTFVIAIVTLLAAPLLTRYINGKSETQAETAPV
ncbi:Dipeptide and tripeptide permease B [Piscirickettsia salmonis]|uniref:Dipeptide and tripeptide permease B n=3 Tax=Piscirickettsia salmonis TaxID=1238 RepID=A0A1L6TGA6_PISSA|nr:oligopeptide:H+ symporter [Piscirickettsia salmonis]AKP72831.1 peptide ABC transporter permease [Piscirickettsia salmonis LF-89 = ATCC VR-1361]ALB21438.1 dipeptide and tripeptide permease B [Piscirickettsia salmonis]ALY01668.1 peptide ABC transporter permease [Piscirickettsia salmonis]AMA41180.1 peptide ABC transporter permease [Piscirickettsia salmonis]AOS36369.1 peptide ABC transporter permease [Piscirickettsia salmonis]